MILTSRTYVSSRGLRSLLQDYTSFVIPNSDGLIFQGHLDPVKCLSFVGDEGQFIVSGSR
jgi:hypothetical protein